MTIGLLNNLHLWQLVSRLGEAQILLPAALLATLALLRRPDGRPLAAWWMGLLAAAVLLTTVSKLAFIGWGIGWPELNFTGVSGHAMFAAAVYPLLLGTLAGEARGALRRLALAVGFGVALLVGLSRLVVDAHSVSEVVAGLLLGGAVSTVALAAEPLPRMLMGPLIPAAMALWFVFMPAHAPASNTHSVVTRLALALSGHPRPYTRSDMLRKLRAAQRPGKSNQAPSTTTMLDREARVRISSSGRYAAEW